MAADDGRGVLEHLRAVRDTPPEVLSSSEKLVLVALTLRANKKHRCWPGVAKLAYDTSLSVKTVRAAIKTLSQKGLLKVEKRTSAYGDRESNLYTLKGYGKSAPTPGKLAPTVGQESTNGVGNGLPEGYGKSAPLTPHSNSPVVNSPLNENTRADDRWSDVLTVSKALDQAFHLPETKLRAGDRRAQKVLARLEEGFTVEDLCGACRGAARDEHFQKNRQFQTLVAVLRDAAQVDRFLNVMNEPIRPQLAKSPAPTQPWDGSRHLSSLTR